MGLNEPGYRSNEKNHRCQTREIPGGGGRFSWIIFYLHGFGLWVHAAFCARVSQSDFLASGSAVDSVADKKNSGPENNLGQNPGDFVRLPVHRVLQFDSEWRSPAGCALFSSVFSCGVLSSGQGRLELAVKTFFETRMKNTTKFYFPI